MKTLVFCDKNENYAELCSGGKSLGGETVAYVIGSKNDASQCPADKVYFTQKDETKSFEDYFNTFIDIVTKENPTVIVTLADRRGRNLAARTAAVLQTSTITDIASLKVEGNNIIADKMYYGGLALNTVKSKGTAVITVGFGFFEANCSDVAEDIEEISFKDVATGIIRKEIRKKEGGTVNLSSAKKVIGIGRGIAKEEDIKLIEDLASLIQGEVGCSRPIAEGEGWMATNRYIGVSGLVLKPDVYLAIGISGQIQHMIGVNGSKTIIAINKDKNAPIFKSCDYGMVGDLYKIIPELTKSIKG